MASDDGTDEYGQPAGYDNGDRFLEPVTVVPAFSPLELGKVSWTSLDPGLMTRILDLPIELDELERRLVRYRDHDDPIPWNVAWFAHRRRWYGDMAVKVIEIMKELRDTLGSDQGNTALVRSEVEESRRTQEAARVAYDAWKARDELRLIARQKEWDAMGPGPAVST
ncbi:hypothetical protein [Variovorax sp. OV329]|uniref:hypothetical protein n=1 Tax=Variovorax sp. OV329 TaxID=1882825 RepID=UPI000B81F196|nr:hypothetical protein [Variovorax sp. OV329]